MQLLTVSNLYKRFNLEAGFFARFGRFVNAVNDISFSIGENEAYGLVGESGCGKTTTARMLVRMYDADSGEIIFRQGESGRGCLINKNSTTEYTEYHGEKDIKFIKTPDMLACQNSESSVVKNSFWASLSVGSLKKEALRQYREKVRYVFQDPARSLNPRMSVYDVLVSGCRQPLKKRGIGERELRKKAAAILEEVGLQAADLEKRPSEFSGGQRQRISIARALLMEPQLLICDEVVSALDVSIQGQILNLLLDIRKNRDMSFLFIAHDLKVACYFCDRIGVMYRGELMEEAPAADLYKQALHPYTKLLFSSASGVKSQNTSHGDIGVVQEVRYNHGVPQLKLLGVSQRIKDNNPIITPCTSVSSVVKNSIWTAQMSKSDKFSNQCSFAQRCPIATERCFSEHPELLEKEKGHFLRCFNYSE